MISGDTLRYYIHFLFIWIHTSNSRNNCRLFKPQLTLGRQRTLLASLTASLVHGRLHIAGVLLVQLLEVSLAVVRRHVAESQRVRRDNGRSLPPRRPPPLQPAMRMRQQMPPQWPQHESVSTVMKSSEYPKLCRQLCNRLNIHERDIKIFASVSEADCL